MIKKKANEIVAMVTKLNMITMAKSSDCWLDFGATIYVCNDKAMFSTYKEEEYGQLVLLKFLRGSFMLLDVIKLKLWYKLVLR